MANLTSDEACILIADAMREEADRGWWDKALLQEFERFVKAGQTGLPGSEATDVI